MFASVHGFTIIEVIVSLGLLVLIVAIGVPVGIDSYRNYIIFAEVRSLVSILRRAESLALANTRSSGFGINIGPNEFILFQGSSFVSRNASYDESYPRSPSVNFTGPSEIVFAPLSGLPNATGTITLSNDLNSRTIDINSQGSFSW